MAGCTRCQGTGWILLASGGVPVARRCDCSLLSRALRLKDRIGIPQRHEHCTLETFSPATLSQARAFLSAKKFCESYPASARGLLFTGDPGTGKTHLAVGIVRELALKVKGDTLFLNFGSMADRFQGGCPWERAKKAELLVIDDLGSTVSDERTFPAIQDLLEARVRERKPMILTTGRVRLRIICSDSAGEYLGAPEAFLRRLPPSLLFSLLGQLRKISMAGEDFRKQRRNAPLF
jgi:DNA replication protein DnaC